MQQSNTNHIFLNASAGSGKTFALCVRYIALLFQGVPANEILTLTFTKKAANEMKERITQNLFLLYITQDSKLKEAKEIYKENYEKILKQRDDIIESLLGYNLTKEHIEAQTTKVYKHFLQADKKISTIDSFYTQMLRKFAFFIGIRRDFDMQESGLDDEIFECFLEKIYTDSHLHEALLSLTNDLNIHIDMTTNYGTTLTLKQLLATLYDKSIEFSTKQDLIHAMHPLFTQQKILEFAKTFMSDEVLESLLCHVEKSETSLQNGQMQDNEILESIKDFSPFLKAQNDKNIESNPLECATEFESQKIENIESKQNLDSINYALNPAAHPETLQLNPKHIEKIIQSHAKQLSDFLQNIAPNGEVKPRTKAICEKLENSSAKEILQHKLIVEKKHNYIKQDLKLNEAMQQEIAYKCEQIQQLGILYTMCVESALLSHLYMFLEIYTQAIREIESKHNILSFQSIAHKVFAIATDTLMIDGDFQSDYFFFRLDSCISHILFDEYQDTSIMQYRIFEPLFNEILAGSGTKDSKSLFFVGDSKQSLYAFRGANISVFEKTKRLDSMQQESLSHNYRSKKAIIDFVNDKFANLYKEEYIKQLYSEHSQDISGVVNVKLYEDTGDKEINKNAVFIDTLTQLNRLIESNVPKKEIVILARKRDTLHEFNLFLKENDSTIKLNLDKSGKLINQPSIQAIFYVFKTQEYRDEIKLIESRLGMLQDSMQKATIQQDFSPQDSKPKDSTESLQEKLRKARNNYKFAQKKLNKLLGKSYFDNQYITIPQQTSTYYSLAKSIKSIIESLRFYNDDCMELLEIASENIDIKSIDSLFELIENRESVIMQEEAIHAMSVHGSKGLGFEYVIYLDYEAQKQNNNEKILYSYNDIFLDSIRIDTTTKAMNIYRDKTLQDLADKKERENLQQEYNNLYVACTRAKIGLYIFANKESSIATHLALKDNENYGEEIQTKRDSKQAQNNLTIISKLQAKNTTQEEFLQEKKDSFYQHNISMQHKQILGLSLHYSLELMLGFGIKNPYTMLNFLYGFYLDESMIVEILQKANNIFKSSLEKLLYMDKNTIKCELSFLQENSIKRLDALIQNGEEFFVIEFKSSQNISEALLQEHTAQLQSYMESIATISQKKSQIKGYLVYLQDNVAVKEITL